MVDESGFFGYNSFNIKKAVKGRVSFPMPFREPLFGVMGYGKVSRTWSRSRAGDR